MGQAFTVWLHLLAVTVWIGPQFFMFLAALPAIREIGDRQLRAKVIRIVVTRFGYMAWAALLIIVLTGISNIFQVTDDFPYVFDYDYRYAQLFSAKMTVLGATVALTAVHTFIVGPQQMRLAEEPETAPEESTPSMTAATGEHIMKQAGRMPTRFGIAVAIAVAVLLLVGIGGRAAAPAMADKDCFRLDGLEPQILGICIGDADAGGWCAGFGKEAGAEGAEGSKDAALLCAWPALLAQEVPFVAFLVGAPLIAGLALSAPFLAKGVGGELSREAEVARLRRTSMIISSLAILGSIIVLFLGALLANHEWSFQAT